MKTMCKRKFLPFTKDTKNTADGLNIILRHDNRFACRVLQQIYKHSITSDICFFTNYYNHIL